MTTKRCLRIIASNVRATLNHAQAYYINGEGVSYLPGAGLDGPASGLTISSQGQT
jgi:hypothetical protein